MCSEYKPSWKGVLDSGQMTEPVNLILAFEYHVLTKPRLVLHLNSSQFEAEHGALHEEWAVRYGSVFVYQCLFGVSLSHLYSLPELVKEDRNLTMFEWYIYIYIYL